MIRLANKVAGGSKFARARVGAVITKGGRVISTGVNKIGSSSKLKGKPTHSAFIHAEEAAILPLLQKGRQHQLVGATIYVSRILKNGTPALSKPCPHCTKLIAAVGIKKVYYTTETGTSKLC